MAERRPALISLYRGLATALVPLLHLLFWRRSRRGKEIAARKGERFGTARRGRPSGPLIWVHAASVGETMSILPLIERLAAEGKAVMLTTVTVTAAELAESRLPEGCFHQFAPYDAPGLVGPFLDHWKPDLALTVESEIWPCMFSEVRRRQIPFALVNARMSESSGRGWQRFSSAARYIFGCLDLVCAQSAADAERFRQLGCGRVETPGNLKFDAPEPAADADAVAALSQQIEPRQVWLAALTHPGEDEIVLEAYQQLLSEYPDLLLILVPRHPARADAVAALIEQTGFQLARRSANTPVQPDTQVYLGDTLGEMGLYYRLAPVTFLGGSFNEAGGHNPVEALLLGSALLTGPKVANARAVYKDLWAEAAGVRVMDPALLAGTVGVLLEDQEGRARQVERAHALVMKGRGALQKTVDLLQSDLLGKSQTSGQDTDNGRRT